MKNIAAASLASLLLVSTAGAVETDRYVLEKTATGYVRMDRLTGEMSLCAEQDGQLACRVANDDRKAMPDVDALTRRVDELEKAVAALKGVAPPAAGLPSDEEFEKAMGFMERFFRRFMGIVKGLEEESGSPQKT